MIIANTLCKLDKKTKLLLEVLSDNGYSIENVINEGIITHEEYLSFLRQTNTNKEDILTRTGNINFISYGAYGMVYKMRHELDGKNYAIKIIQINEKNMKRKIREVEIMSSLKSKKIIRYYNSWIYKHLPDYFLPDKNNKEMVLYHQPKNNNSYLFIQMELCDKTLRDWLEQTKKRPSSQSIIAQLLNCVEYLHIKNITHGDIKAENVFLAGKKIKLGDFGKASTNPKIKDYQKDIYHTGLLILEILYPKITMMERLKLIEKIYHNKTFPLDFPIDYQRKLIKYINYF